MCYITIMGKKKYKLFNILDFIVYLDRTYVSTRMCPIDHLRDTVLSKHYLVKCPRMSLSKAGIGRVRSVRGNLPDGG